MIDKYIPQITIDCFEEVFIEDVCDTLRITKEEFNNRLENTENFSFNSKAEKYISTYLFNKIDNLSDDNWIIAKELYIQWKIFEGIDKEEVSIDKKKTLHEILDLYKISAEKAEEVATKVFYGMEIF
ncbi:MAG: hypothetical protein ACRC1R_05150 [Cetobacterium sp.]|uniref:hypothetical protein n=1 Tax=Cetobacterium sp. TaxID=2071632 RepID=UPI003F2BD5EF